MPAGHDDCMGALVPIDAAAVFTSAAPSARAVYAGAGVQLGARVAIDTDLLPASEATALLAWWEQTRHLWDHAAHGSGLEWVATSRQVMDRRQVTSKTGRADLVEEFEAAESIAALREALHEASERVPDVEAVCDLAASLGGVFTFDETASTGQLQVRLSGSLLYPDALGGLAHPGETSREVTMLLRYAAWRDRRVRRLAAVQVTLEQLWAPVPARAA